RKQPDTFPGWFTHNDYEDGMREIQDSLAMGYAPSQGCLLDLGCGAGNFSIRLAGLGYEVTGIDISNTAIEWARLDNSGPSVTYLCSNAVTLTDFEDDAFDFAFDGHFLHCIIGDDRRTLLQNVKRVLRPGGYFMVRSIVWPVTSGGGALKIDEETHTAFMNGTPYRYYTAAEDLVDEVESAGFGVRHWRYTVTSSDGYGFQHVVMQCVKN
ncbi:MAG: class I SAM-dependent methyltransferase, partial [Pseudomonadota bacterium]